MPPKKTTAPIAMALAMALVLRALTWALALFKAAFALVTWTKPRSDEGFYDGNKLYSYI